MGVTTILLIAGLCAAPAFAASPFGSCAPAEPSIDFTFAADPKVPNGLIIKRHAEGKDKEKLLDTTGYAGFLVLATRVWDVFRDAEHFKVTPDDQSETKRFLRLQIKELSAFLTQKNSKTPALGKLAEMDKLLNESTSPDMNKFNEIHMSLRKLLAAETSVAKIQYRASGAADWNSEPNDVSDFTLWAVCNYRCPCGPANGTLDYKGGIEAYSKSATGSGAKTNPSGTSFK